MREEVKLSKDDLDYIISELKQNQKETASSIVMETPKPINMDNKIKLSLPLGKLLLGSIIIGLIVFISGYKYIQSTEKTKSTVIVENIKKLATLATAQQRCTDVIDYDNSKSLFELEIPGLERVLFMVIPGDVIAGVDLKSLTKEDISLDNRKKTINITLPHATIVGEPSIDMKNIQSFSDSGIFRGDIDWKNDYQKQLSSAQINIKKEAIQNGILVTAEDNARQAIQTIFENTNFSKDYSVNISFK